MINVEKLFTLSVSLNSWINFKPDQYSNYQYEPIVQFFGWVLELSPLAVVIIIGAYEVYKRHKAGKSINFISTGPMLEPKESWGPRLDRVTVANEQDNYITTDGKRATKLEEKSLNQIMEGEENITFEHEGK